jgi:hypothetical protein
VRLGVQHIPQQPSNQWIHDHLHDFVDFKQRLTPPAIRLAHITLDGTAIHAEIRLGIPRLAADNAIRVINRALASSAHHTAFGQVVGTLVEHLDTATDLVDYDCRRDAHRTRQIPPGQWRDLIEGYPG